MIYFGIDPGARGAVGVVDPGQFGTVAVWRQEIHDLPQSRGEVLTLFSDLIGNNSFAALERPGYGPPMGKSAAVKLRESFERCAMALVAAGIPFEEVSPQEWKKVLFKGVEIKKGKEGKAQARARAMELFPSLADQLSRVKDDGRAEALLLAEYARRLRA